MPRRRVTVAIDHDLWQQVRRLAANKQTTATELVRQLLQRFVADERRLAWESIRDLVENPRVKIGGRLPSRDELHER